MTLSVKTLIRLCILALLFICSVGMLFGADMKRGGKEQQSDRVSILELIPALYWNYSDPYLLLLDRAKNELVVDLRDHEDSGCSRSLMRFIGANNKQAVFQYRSRPESLLNHNVPAEQLLSESGKFGTFVVYDGVLGNKVLRKLNYTLADDEAFVPVRGGFLGNRVVVFPDTLMSRPLSNFVMHNGSRKLIPYPLIEENGKLRPFKELPAGKFTDTFREACKYGLVELRNGHDVLVWNGMAYEFDGKTEGLKPVASWKLETLTHDLSSVPAGDDGFFYISDEKLFEVHSADRTPVQHLKSFEGLWYVRPGPNDSLLLNVLLGLNPKGLGGYLYFPKKNEVITIPGAIFETGYPSLIQQVVWCKESKEFATHMGNNVYMIPESAILSLERKKVTAR